MGKPIVLQTTLGSHHHLNTSALIILKNVLLDILQPLMTELYILFIKSQQ